MKKLYLLLSFLILFQGCFSYKTVNYDIIPIEKKQKVEVKAIGGINIKGTLVSKNEQTLTLDTNGQLQEISVDKIYEVKVRKFSLLKSSGLFAGSALVVTAVLFAVFLGVLIGL